MFFHTTAASYGYHHAGRSPNVLWRANRKFRPSIRIIPTNNKAAALVLPMRWFEIPMSLLPLWKWGVSNATFASPAQRSRCTTRSRLQTTPPPSLLKQKKTLSSEKEINCKQFHTSSWIHGLFPCLACKISEAFSHLPSHKWTRQAIHLDHPNGSWQCRSGTPFQT